MVQKEEKKKTEETAQKVLQSMRTRERLYLPKTARMTSDILYIVLAAKAGGEDQTDE